MKSLTVPFVLHNSLLLLLSCSDPPTQRHSLEWVTLDQSGSIGVLRMTQSDTGWFKGTAHFKATMWTPNQSALEFWDHAPASHLIWQDATKQIGSRHSITNQQRHWQLDSHFDEWNLRMMGDCTSNDYTWTIEKWTTTVHCADLSNLGWSQSHDQSQILSGNSWIVAHEGSTVIEHSIWMLATTASLRLMIEEDSLGLRGHIETRSNADDTWTTHSLKSVTHSEQSSIINTDAGSISIQKSDIIGVEDPYQHIASWERWLTESIFPMNTIQWNQAVGTWEEKPFVVLIRTQNPSLEH